MKLAKFLSIRTKLIALVLGTIMVSLGSYLVVGTRLVLSDKVSYLYEFNMFEASRLSSSITSRLEEVAQSLRGVNASQHAAVQKFARFDRRSDSDGLKILGDTPRDKELLSALNVAGWNGTQFAGKSYELAYLGGDRLLLGCERIPGQANSEIVVALLAIRNLFTMSQNGRTPDYAVVSGDKVVFATENLDREILRAVPEFSQAYRNVESGVREWKGSKDEFVVGFSKITATRFSLLMATNKAQAFAASKTLAYRSIFMGLSIGLLAIGVVILLSQSIVRRIKNLWIATSRVSEGDFSVRIVGDESVGDELGALSFSFNTMAGKITALMEETAYKARMEKELQTAKIVQERFYPKGSYSGREIELAGQVVPAAECGGDWWYYEELGRKLVVIIGDVTGHGVPAALLTGAAHVQFCATMERFRRDGSGIVSAKQIAEDLNFAVYSAAGGDSTMTLYVSVIDLDTGEMRYVNASHRPPYVVTQSKLTPVGGQIGEPLGTKLGTDYFENTSMLKAGQWIFWYTDGVFENPNPEGKVLPKKEAFRLISEATQVENPNANDALSLFLMKGVELYSITDPHGEAKDDVTVILAKISSFPHAVVPVSDELKQSIPQPEATPTSAEPIAVIGPAADNSVLNASTQIVTAEPIVLQGRATPSDTVFESVEPKESKEPAA